MTLLDTILLWVITGIYGVYGLFSLYCAYNILSRKNFQFVTGYDERYTRNLKNQEKFARDYSLPHILIGLNCLLAVVIVAIFGFSSMMISVAITIVLFGYGTSITRRMPERLRRGRYM